VHFDAHADGLHYHDTNHCQLTMASTVAQESEGFSEKQIVQAKTARDFQTKVGHPSTQDLKSVIKLNLIANCPGTTEDVDWAETIFGPSLPILKGKTTRQSPQLVQTDYVAVPESILSANQHVTLFGDIFFINKVPFFATVSDQLKFTTTEHIANRKLKQLASRRENKRVWNNFGGQDGILIWGHFRLNLASNSNKFGIQFQQIRGGVKSVFQTIQADQYQFISQPNHHYFTTHST
jgi:hypothetical protein